MAHPKESKRQSGRLWHLEDSKLSYCQARSLKTHLIHTEGKRAKTHKAKDGWEVWWARR